MLVIFETGWGTYILSGSLNHTIFVYICKFHNKSRVNSHKQMFSTPILKYRQLTFPVEPVTLALLVTEKWEKLLYEHI